MVNSKKFYAAQISQENAEEHKTAPTAAEVQHEDAAIDEQLS